MYRIIHNLVDIPVEPYLTPLTSMTRGHDSCIHQIRTTNNTYQQSFFPRTIVLWNQLLQTAVSQTTLEAFQNQLATHTFLTPHLVFIRFKLLYIRLLSVACGHPPPHCENTQVLREAITEDDDDDESFVPLWARE